MNFRGVVKHTLDGYPNRPQPVKSYWGDDIVSVTVAAAHFARCRRLWNQLQRKSKGRW